MEWADAETSGKTHVADTRVADWPRDNGVPMTEAEVIRAIRQGAVPSDMLVCREGWRRICQVRRKNFDRVNEVAWQCPCAERDYLEQRSDPRGF